MSSVELTCFVIMGYGPKKDHESGRTLDLDKTYENLIKPVFKKMKINCFRAKDIRHTGIIDVPMYEWIYKADIVVADLSTLNSNALYELGVRHALKPFTTIVISEDKCPYPFDINHTVIEQYEHLGKDIGASESSRFKKELEKKVKAVLKIKKPDSPVYTFLPNLIPPELSKEISGGNTITEPSTTDPSLSELIQDAERAKNNNDFKISSELYKVCLKFEPNNVFLNQRLALVTYKSEKPNIKKSLLDAKKIIDKLNPDESTDNETLGIAGAITKRLFEYTNEEHYLDQSIRFYEKGFYINEDYYNGINLAYLYNIKASITKNAAQKLNYKNQAFLIRLRIVKICTNLIASREFNKREDQHWVYQSLAQAYLGLNETGKMNKTIKLAKQTSEGQFDIDTFMEQNSKLIALLK